jgi:RNA polymerase sigma factor (sigma-70 family)
MQDKTNVVEAFLSGEEWAFNALYTQYRQPMARFVSGKLRRDECVQDCVQEIFLKVYRFRNQYDPTYAFSTWLWSIARNTVVDSLRKMRGKPAVLDEEAASEVPCPRPLVDEVIDAKLQKKHLNKMFDELTALQRKVLKLRLGEQLSYKEIAKRLDVSVSSVKCLMYRATQTLTPAI